ncbi:MAG: lysine--tRNA ligase [Acidimicrobiia bacterium]
MDSTQENHSTSSDEDIKALRLDKVNSLRSKNINPYPTTGQRSALAGDLHAKYGDLEPEHHTGEIVSVAGRIVLKRDMGKLSFATLRDSSGSIQLFVSKNEMGDNFDSFVDLDLGDWVSAQGEVITSKKGELSIKTTSVDLLSKCLRPLPDKFKGMTDVDQIYRQRELDLIMNEESKKRFEIRHKAIASVRKTLVNRGYVEVEGPVLHDQPGGATARPFVTHHNALDMDLHLRIALELHLKRLVVAGIEKVFEIGRVFRNEGISTRHNPEFTMMECYEALGDYKTMMDVAQDIVFNAAMDSIGRSDIVFGGIEISLKPPFKQITMIDLVENAIGEKMHPSMDRDQAVKIAKAHGLEKIEDHWGVGKIIGELYEEHAEKHIVQPTFVMDYPTEISPLAKQKFDDPHITERFELVIAGRELGNAFSELNDPVEQRLRFEEEQKAKEAGDDEAGSVDESYLRAIEYGLPPTGGLGIGMDRLAMLLAETQSIRDIVLFPTLRPEDL